MTALFANGDPGSGLPRSLTPVMLLDWIQVPESAWRMHAPFAGWLVEAQRPRTVVELGTHWGFSYFAMCSAAAAIGHEMRANAVDHWRGEEHAGEYDEEVFDFVESTNRENFGDWSRLLRTGFDEAAESFDGESVDLLHIDGFHSYEAVEHDFTTWQRTLSRRSVVLFHDVREYQEGFGVHRFWDEVRHAYPSFTFPFGHGLGVLATGADVPEGVRALCREDATSTGDAIRLQFQVLGQAVELAARREALESELEACRARARDAAAQHELLVEHIANLDADRDRLVAHIANLEADRERLVVDRDRLDVELAGITSSRRWQVVRRLHLPGRSTGS